jgi:drug/metabolite transporter (DMT)-like permease
VGSPDSQIQVAAPSAAQASTGQATVMLVLATVLWGLSFPLTKDWQNAVGSCPGGTFGASLILITLRMFLALPIFAAIVPRLFRLPSWHEHGLGVIVGLANSVGFLLQVWGQAMTTPAQSSFLTSLASAWVPILGFLCFRTSVRGATLCGLGLGMGGAATLSLSGDETWTLGLGNTLTLLSSVGFAVEIVLLDRLGRGVPAGHLTIGFLLGTGVPVLGLAVIQAASRGEVGAWFTWTTTMMQEPAILRDVLLLTVLSTVAASYCLTAYQPLVPASRAALIYLLEPVFASLFSILWGLDSLTARLALGGGLILGGNLLVEIPAWFLSDRGRQAPSDPSGGLTPPLAH